MSLISMVFLSDFLVVQFNNLKRYHIGRWNNKEDWENSVNKCAIKWISNPPEILVGDQREHVLLHLIKKNQASMTVQSWQHAELLLGVCAYNHTSEKFVNEIINKYLTNDGNWKNAINKIDYALLSYSLLKNVSSPQKIKPAMDEMYKFIAHNTCEDQMVSYSQGKKTTIRYVDTLGMVCGFLQLYGHIYNNDDAVKLGYHQIVSFHKEGLYKGTVLANHAYDSRNGLPLGVIGWGRGTGWYLISLADSHEVMHDSHYKKIIEDYMYEAAEYLSRFQHADGGFMTILQGGGQYDSSITAIMAYFYAYCFKLSGEKKYSEISRHALEKLKELTMKSGAIDGCQGDTHGLGIFSQNFDVMPFAQGLTLRTLAIIKADR